MEMWVLLWALCNVLTYQVKMYSTSILRKQKLIVKHVTIFLLSSLNYHNEIQESYHMRDGMLTPYDNPVDVMLEDITP